MRDVIVALSGRVRNIAALTESRFLVVGEKLDRATGILGALTDTFGGLSSELESDAVREATRKLSEAAARIQALGVNHAEQAESLRELAGLIASIERHAREMDKAIRSASSLSINVKIEASAMGAAGSDFLAFSGDIDRSLKRAQQNLQSFAQELTQLAGHLGAAQAEDQAIARRHGEAMKTIPRRLGEGVETMAERGRRAAIAAQAVGTISAEMRTRVGSVVMALQIGDATRQRAEHVSDALADVESALMRADAPAGLPEACCTLQSAQLTDAADALETEIRQIAVALRQLAVDARNIVRAGHDAFGAAGSEGSFVTAVEADVAQAQRLVDDYEAARRAANGAVSAVSVAAERLQHHIRTIRSMESDLRIMGLNTTLKCGRVGARARSLAAIAHELRIYAGAMAGEAEAVMTDMAQLAAISEALTGAGSASGDDQASVADVMSEATGRLATAGHSLDDALSRLEGESKVVARLLQETAAGMGMSEEIGEPMRSAGSELRQCAGGVSITADGLFGAEPIVTRMLQRYTMAHERKVHAAIIGGLPDDGMASAAADTATDADDVLF